MSIPPLISKLNPFYVELVSGTGDSIYDVNGTIGSGRVATLTDTLTWADGQEIRIVNGRTIKEVTQASDLPAALVANTTYIVRGEVTITTNTVCNVEGVEIIGLDRNGDHLVWGGTGTFLTILDCNFSIRHLKFSDSTGTPGNQILVGTNFTTGVPANNYGRTKVLQIFGCEFRGTVDVFTVTGFELVDVNNTLFWYITGANGLRFQDVRHLEISSCEVFNWFDEPTATTYSTASMIEILANGPDNVGIAVLNINSSIIHPEQTQIGLDVNTLSTTRFGTISSNTFIDVGLTTGKLFLPEAFSLPDYSQTATFNFDIFANQGLLNSTSGCVITCTGNTTDTALSSGVPVAIDTGGGATLQAAVRYIATTAGRATYNGTKQVYVSIHSSLTYQKQGGGVDTYIFYIYKNGTLLPGSGTEIVGSNTVDEGAFSIVYGTLMSQNDYIEIYVENTASNDDMLVKDFQIVIRE